MNKKYKITSSVMVVIVIALVIAFNVFITALTGKFPVKLDMTPEKVYSITDSTKEYLKSYNTPTEIFILASEAKENMQIKNILNKYAAENSNIKITNIDTDANPTFGQKYTENGENLSGKYLIVDGGERFKTFAQADLYIVDQKTGNAGGMNAEAKITSALKYVSSKNELNAYIVTGHNEINDLGVRGALEGENYNVSEVNLITEEIPDDASILIVLSPKSDFTVAETAKLDSYFTKGGHAQIYLDVLRSEKLTNLYSYLTKWGIQVNDAVAREQNSKNILSLGGTTTLVVPEIASDDITDSIIKNNRTIAYLPYSKTLTKLFDDNNSISVKPLLTTSTSAYETSNYDDLSQKDGVETNSYNIGILASNSQNNSSIYVSGTSMLLNFTKDDMDASYGFANYDYFMNICSFMQGNTDDYTISPKSMKASALMIKPIAAYAIGIIFVIVIPLILLITGIVVWFKRRHL